MNIKTIYIFSIILLFAGTLSKAQTALQISGTDCNNVSHDLFAELDVGKASIIYFFMDNCPSCPPPAKKIQTMVNNILLTYPNRVTAYAMPYSYGTNCALTAAWVTSHSLNLYAPYDSGAAPVAYYGGFGMPTVVLVGGSDHRTLFKSQIFDTLVDVDIMRDSILALFASGPSSLNHLPDHSQNISISPNPSSNNTIVSVELKETANLFIDVVDVTGKQMSSPCHLQKAHGNIHTTINTAMFPNGIYCIQIHTNGKTTRKQLKVIH